MFSASVPTSRATPAASASGRSVVSRHQHGLAQCRGFFLNATGVGDDQVATIHQIDKGQIFLRLDQMNVGRGTAVRIPACAHWGSDAPVNNVHIRVALCQFEQAIAEAGKFFAKILGR
jgi:hypothetical protein